MHAITCKLDFNHFNTILISSLARPPNGDSMELKGRGWPQTISFVTIIVIVCLMRIVFFDISLIRIYLICILVVRRQKVLTAIIRSFVWAKCSKASKCYSVDVIVIKKYK